MKKAITAAVLALFTCGVCVLAHKLYKRYFEKKEEVYVEMNNEAATEEETTESED